jgi:hypothetical protein
MGNLQDRIDELATNSNNKNIKYLYRGINAFMREYQTRCNLVKDENGDLLADSHNILNRWNNHFSQLLNIRKASDVRQIEIHTAKQLLPQASTFETEIAIAKLKKYKSPGSDQNPAELIQAGGETLWREIYKPMILFGVRKKCLISGSVHYCTSLKKSIKLIVMIIMEYHCYQLHTEFYLISFSQG